MNCTENGCLTAAVMFGVPGIRVLEAGDDGRQLLEATGLAASITNSVPSSPQL